MGSLELWLHFVGIFGRVFIKKTENNIHVLVSITLLLLLVITRD